MTGMSSALVDPFHYGRSRQQVQPYHHAATNGDAHGHGHGMFGGIADWTDIIAPRAHFNMWDMAPNKLRTAAVAFTFVVTAGYISMLAAGGLLAILFTGAVVTCCVMVVVLVATTLITLLITGVPIGYALWRLLMHLRHQQQLRMMHQQGYGFQHGGRGGAYGWHQADGDEDEDDDDEDSGGGGGRHGDDGHHQGGGRAFLPRFWPFWGSTHP